MIKKFIAHDGKCSTYRTASSSEGRFPGNRGIIISVKLHLDRHGLLRKLHCDEYFMAILDLTFRYGLHRVHIPYHTIL